MAGSLTFLVRIDEREARFLPHPSRESRKET